VVERAVHLVPALDGGAGGDEPVDGGLYATDADAAPRAARR
jgi:hypothetical protein